MKEIQSSVFGILTLQSESWIRYGSLLSRQLVLLSLIDCCMWKTRCATTSRKQLWILEYRQLFWHFAREQSSCCTASNASDCVSNHVSEYQSIGKVVVHRSSVRRFPSHIKKWTEKSLDRLIKLEIKNVNLNPRYQDRGMASSWSNWFSKTEM